MNNVEKTITKAQLKLEQRALKELQKTFKQAKQDCERQISALNARKDMQNLQSIIYQKKYQDILLKQIEGVLDDLNKGQYETLQDFFEGSYATGYIGSMYDLHNQGIPLVIPIDPKKMVTAVMTDSKLSKNYYQNRFLPENLSTLKRNIRQELTRGIASGKTWVEVAYQIAEKMNSPFNRAMRDAMRIVRTEGHRINQQGFLDASHEAKKKGADVVKQWDATLDGNTRPAHRIADGQIRELDEKFDVDGEKMDAPSIGGSARNVCNCRCQLLQRARWSLDEKELKTLQNRASFFGLDKSEGFEDFKQKYLKLPDKTDVVIKNSCKGLVRPKRPKKEDFDDYDELIKAREKFKEDLDLYKEKVQSLIEVELSKPRKYNSKDAIIEWCKKHDVRFEKSFLENVDFRIMDDVIEVQERLFEKYPFVKSNQDLYYKYGFDFKTDGGSSSYLFEASGGLNFGATWTDYEESLYKIYDSLADGYFTMGDGTVQTTITHEFGHNLDYFIRETKFNTMNLHGVNDKDEIMKKNSDKRKYESELIELTSQFNKTEYGFTNISEAFAEGFAQYETDPNSEYGKAFGEFLERWL